MKKGARRTKPTLLLLMLLSLLLITVSTETIDRKVKQSIVKKQEQEEQRQEEQEAAETSETSDTKPGKKQATHQKVKDIKKRKQQKAKPTKKKARTSNVQQQFEPKTRLGPNANEPVPTAVFHGFKQSCGEDKLKENVQYIREGTEGYVECIEIGDGVVASMFTSLVKQAKEACKKINDHQVFGSRQFNVVGISQGALIARYIVETCITKYQVRNLVTVGGPNNGMELGTDCSGKDELFRCQLNTRIRSFPMLNTFSKVIQSTLGPTNYVRNYQNHQSYLDHSLFLPYLNNEKENPRVESNKLRFQSLNSLTMIMFNNDQVIFPKESEWFGQIDPSGKVVPMEATDLYTKDTFGLRTLDEQQRIFKYQKEGEHLEYGPEYIKMVIVPALLR